MEFVARTDTGKRREQNQDNACAFVHAGFLVGIVADGMGGHNGGQVASRMAIDCVRDYLMEGLEAQTDTQQLRKLLRVAYVKANAEIFALATQNKDLEGMGTTLTVAVLRENVLVVSHIGDSRAYICKALETEQITVDQTLVQRLLSSGVISQEEAKTHPHRHVILEAVGTSATIEPEMYERVLSGQTLLLCSDGLYGEVPDSAIAGCLFESGDLGAAADNLVAAANAAGGSDNISVVLMR